MTIPLLLIRPTWSTATCATTMTRTKRWAKGDERTRKKGGVRRGGYTDEEEN